MSFAFRLSLGANIVLMGIVAVLLWRDPTAAHSSAASSLGATSVRPEPEPSKPSPTALPLPPNSTAPKLTRAAVAQLEQMGIARDTLVNVLLEDLNRRTGQRVLDLQRKYAPKQVPEREMRELSRQSGADQVRELKTALGEDGYRAWDKAQTLRALNCARLPGDELPMSAEEAEQAYRLQKEFDEKNQGLQWAMEDGVADRADAGTLQAQAQQALDRELEKLLGKPRFDALRGNVDPATEVYRTYGDLNPTPVQAKAVLQAEADYRAREAVLAKRLAENPAEAAKVTVELKALGEARDEELRRTFGAEAYDAAKRQNDPTYQSLQQYAEAWELKPQDLPPVYETLRAFQDQAERMRSAAEMSEAAGQRVNWREVNAAVEQARQQAEAGLQNLVGAERLRRLKQNGVLGGP